jgi:hypothetical protein
MSTNLFERIQKTVPKTKSIKKEFKDNPEEFFGWFAKFHNKERGYAPGSVPAFFDNVEKKHADIREIINGVRVNNEFVLDNIRLQPDAAKIDPLIDELSRVLPYYLVDNLFERAVLYKPNLDNGMRTGKHIAQYAARNYPSSYIERVNNIVSKLGECWANTKTITVTLNTTLSTSAKAFVMLGHYGPDNASCFGQTGCNAINKFTLAECKNTFVFLIKDKEGRIYEPTNSKNTLARLWGFMDIENKVVNFCNYYSRHIRDSEAFETCKRQAAQMLNIPLENVACTHNVIRIGPGVNIFLNNRRAGQPLWSFHNKDSVIFDQVLNF